MLLANSCRLYPAAAAPHNVPYVVHLPPSRATIPEKTRCSRVPKAPTLHRIRSTGPKLGTDEQYGTHHEEHRRGSHKELVAAGTPWRQAGEPRPLVHAL